MRHSTLVAAHALFADLRSNPAACADCSGGRTDVDFGGFEYFRAAAFRTAATTPVLPLIPTPDTSTPPSTVSCAEADVNLDLRALPTNVHVDTERESVYRSDEVSHDFHPQGCESARLSQIVVWLRGSV